jgi:hypothetical protein
LERAWLYRIVSGQALSQRRERLLFVNKKKQKTYPTWAGLASAPRAPANKNFSRRFFAKKAAAFLFLAKALTRRICLHRPNSCEFMNDRLVEFIHFVRYV